MKYFLLLMLTLNSLLANEYYAKLEPINTYNVKSSVSGKVLYVNESLESNFADNNKLIHIDDEVNKIELKQTIIKKSSLYKIYKLQENILRSFKKVSSKSKLEKDQQEITILNTRANLSDLDIKIANLKNTIKNKNIKDKGLYISNINVKKGDYVNPGTLIYTAQDLSSGKLNIFVSFDDIEDIKTKIIYINDKKTNIKIHKIYKTADTTHISAYKVEILFKDVKQFSKLLKISFK